MRPLQDLLNEVNDASSMLTLITYTQADLHKAVVAELREIQSS